MRAELTESGILLVAQCKEDDEHLSKIWDAGHLHFVCKSRANPTREFGRKLKRGRLLLTSSVMEWRMVPLGKRHGTGDARKRRTS